MNKKYLHDRSIMVDELYESTRILVNANLTRGCRRDGGSVISSTL